MQNTNVSIKNLCHAGKVQVEIAKVKEAFPARNVGEINIFETWLQDFLMLMYKMKCANYLLIKITPKRNRLRLGIFISINF